MSDFREKVKTISTPRRLGQSEAVPVVNENDGSLAAIHTKHWDGRQDAQAFPPVIRVKAGVTVERGGSDERGE